MDDRISAAVRILREAWDEFGAGAFASSSFQTQGVPLLHLISLHCPELPVYFLDTGFHFPGTLDFRDELTEAFGLRVVTVRAEGDDADRVRSEDVWRSDTDACCELLKVREMAALLGRDEHLCWISGVRRRQTLVRSRFSEREAGPHGVTRVHPMIAWTGDDLSAYMQAHSLPRHPLWNRGYQSIGCWPCTAPGEGRAGRWPGQDKEGCGVHGLLATDPCEEDEEEERHEEPPGR